VLSGAKHFPDNIIDLLIVLSIALRQFQSGKPHPEMAVKVMQQICRRGRSWLEQSNNPTLHDESDLFVSADDLTHALIYLQTQTRGVLRYLLMHGIALPSDAEATSRTSKFKSFLMCDIVGPPIVEDPSGLSSCCEQMKGRGIDPMDEYSAEQAQCSHEMGMSTGMNTLDTDLASRNSQLEGRIRELESYASELERSNLKLKEDNLELERDRKEKNGCIQDLNSCIERSQTEKKQLNDCIQDMNHRIQILEKQKQELNDCFQGLNRRIQDLETQGQRAHSSNHTLDKCEYQPDIRSRDVIRWTQQLGDGSTPWGRQTKQTEIYGESMELDSMSIERWVQELRTTSRSSNTCNSRHSD